MKALNAVLVDFIIGSSSERAITNAALDQEIGQMMECWHLISHKNSNVRSMRNDSAANELRRLLQGVGKNDEGN